MIFICARLTSFAKVEGSRSVGPNSSTWMLMTCFVMTARPFQYHLTLFTWITPTLTGLKHISSFPSLSYMLSRKSLHLLVFHDSHQSVDSSVRQHFACLWGRGSRTELGPTVVSPMIDVSLPRIHSETMARILHHSLSSLQPLDNRTQAKPQQTIKPANHEAPVSFPQASLRSLLQAQV